MFACVACCNATLKDQTLVTRVYLHRMAVFVQTKLVHRNPQGQASLVTMQMCCVCFTEFSSLSSNVKLPCNHNDACSNCWRQFILAKLEDGHASHLQCMAAGCHMPVPLSEARKVLTDEKCDSMA